MTNFLRSVSKKVAENKGGASPLKGGASLPEPSWFLQISEVSVYTVYWDQLPTSKEDQLLFTNAGINQVTHAHAPYIYIIQV